jgi:hypothetical protein
MPSWARPNVFFPVVSAAEGAATGDTIMADDGMLIAAPDSDPAVTPAIHAQITNLMPAIRLP